MISIVFAHSAGQCHHLLENKLVCFLAKLLQNSQMFPETTRADKESADASCPNRVIC